MNFIWQDIGTTTSIEVEGDLIKITDSNPDLWLASRTAYRPVTDVLRLAEDHDELARILRAVAEEVTMGKDRPETEAGTQARLDNKHVTKGQTDNDRLYEGIRLGDQTGRRRGAGSAGEGSNRSARD